MDVKNVKKINSAVGIPAFIAVLILGIVFIIVSVAMSTKKIPENYEMIEAKISKIDEKHVQNIDNDEYEYTAFIDYEYKGAQYKDTKLNYYNSSMKVGDAVNIYVNPDNPAEFETDPSGTVIFLIVGIAITAVGAVGTVYSVMKLAKKKKENVDTSIIDDNSAKEII